MATMNNSDTDSITKSKYSAEEKSTVSGSNNSRAGLAFRIKLNAFFVLLIAAVAIGLVQYFIFKSEKGRMFEFQFNGYAESLAKKSNKKAAEIAGVMKHLSVSTTSLALFKDSEWPRVTIPHFAEKGAEARNISGADLIVLASVVTKVERTPWQLYAFEHQQWVREGLEFQGVNESAVGIPFQIHREIDGRPVFPNSPGPFSAVWQMSPGPVDTAVVNFDLFSNDTYRRVVQFADSFKTPVLSEIVDASTLFGPSAPNASGHPRSLLVHPVWDNFGSQARIVAHFVSVIPWHVFFTDALPGHAGLVTCVVRNACGQTFTYEITGPNLEFKGMGDHHDPQYSDMERTFPLAVYPSILHPGAEVDSSSATHCEYTISLYPTLELHESYHSDAGVKELIVVFLFALGASMVFIFYEFMVQRRAMKLAAVARRTEKIVASMFPENVRRRMLEGGEDKAGAKSSPLAALSNVYLVRNGELSRFLSSSTTRMASVGPLVEEAAAFATKPIADLFLECTLMFADLVGFTAWASVRDPVQVFTLLERLFCSFDGIAKKRGVFKVETVGDCYVAVCGLPVARADHVVVMAGFARDCLSTCNDVMKELEITLGPGTGDMKIRIGMHSGPVVAGVLRGDRSRFQLFGDTVNTASRLESTGEPNQIQVSNETRKLLVAEGHENWLEHRGGVFARGLGELQTYWLLPLDRVHESDIAAEMGAWQEDAAVDTDDTASEASLQKRQRLIEWNFEVLLAFLQQVVHRRNASQRVPAPQHELDRILDLERKYEESTGAVDEVVEVIALPEYSGSAFQYDESTDEISDVVKSQLKGVVAVLASMYRDNPFHSFEHAAHVTMSVSKLLARIVAPGEVASLGTVEEDTKRRFIHDHTYGITSDPLTQFSVVLSALIHDLDHRGVPNFVLSGEDPALAQLYKKRSIAEQNSIDLAWATLMDPNFYELRRCIYGTVDELKRFRMLMVNSVMATDIFDKDMNAFRNNRWALAFQESPAEEERLRATNRKATIVIEHLIQASDVAHTMQHWHIYTRWNERLFREMYASYRSGRMSKNPAEGWYEGEIAFFDKYIIPLAKKLRSCGVFGVSGDEYLNYAEANRYEWEMKGRSIVAAMVEKFNKTD